MELLTFQCTKNSAQTEFICLSSDLRIIELASDDINMDSIRQRRLTQKPIIRTLRNSVTEFLQTKSIIVEHSDLYQIWNSIPFPVENHVALSYASSFTELFKITPPTRLELDTVGRLSAQHNIQQRRTN